MMTPRSGTGANTAERVPTTMRAAPLGRGAPRGQAFAVRQAPNAAPRAARPGAARSAAPAAASGRSPAPAPAPAGRAPATCWITCRYTSVLPLPVRPCSTKVAKPPSAALMAATACACSGVGIGAGCAGGGAVAASAGRRCGGDRFAQHPALLAQRRRAADRHRGSCCGQQFAARLRSGPLRAQQFQQLALRAARAPGRRRPGRRGPPAWCATAPQRHQAGAAAQGLGQGAGDHLARWGGGSSRWPSAPGPAPPRPAPGRYPGPAVMGLSRSSGTLEFAACSITTPMRRWRPKGTRTRVPGAGAAVPAGTR